MKRLSSYNIALSGISCALATIFAIIAMFSPVAKIGMFTISAVFVSLPLTKNMWVGGIIAYVVASIICLFVGNIKAIPFVVFFGAYAIILPLLDTKLYKTEKIAKWLRIVVIIVIKLGFYMLSAYLAYLFMDIIVGDIMLFGWEWNFWMLAGVGLIIFVAYNFIYNFIFANLQVMADKYIKPRR